MADKRRLTIEFIDGKQIRLDFPVKMEGDLNMAASIRKALNENHLSIEVEGILYIFPWTSIKHFRVSPCPAKLPDTTIKGAILIDSDS